MTSWIGQALCAQTDPEIFFPEPGHGTLAARKVCLLCKVRSACLEDAIATKDPYGVRGGLNERQRRKLWAS